MGSNRNEESGTYYGTEMHRYSDPVAESDQRIVFKTERETRAFHQASGRSVIEHVVQVKQLTLWGDDIMPTPSTIINL